MIQISDTFITELLSNPALKKSDARTAIFLLQNPGALSSEELAAGIGVSKKSAGKSIKRLIGAGIIQPGEFQAKRRTLNIPETVIIEPREATEESNKNRFDRLEAMIGALLARPVTVSAPDGQNISGVMPVCSHDAHNTTQTSHIQATMIPTPVTDGVEQATNMTGTVTIQAIEETALDIQAEMIPVSDSEKTKAVSEAIKGTVNDSIVSDLDDAIIRARARLAALASFNQEKQKQPCARTSIEDEFHALFGVHLPAGSDPAAVGVMIARKKAGKLDVKSPLAYLSSLAGKVTPTLATPTDLRPSSMGSVTQTPPLATGARLSHADMARIDAIWDAMDHSQYKAAALAKDQTGKKYPVPVELLARSIFNAEMMAAQGGQYGKGN